MTETLYIASRYIVHHKVKTAILVVSISLILYLPLALRVLVHAVERALMARAAATPLVVGAKGSSLDLAIDTLYFEPKPLESIPMAQAARIDDSGLAGAVPLYTRFQAGRYTIVGTTLEYLDFRGLTVRHGHPMTRLGDCVVGATSAEELGLAPGSHVLSSPDNLFDLAGTYPLKMKVAGVLARTHTPDDRAVFVDVRTAWIIAGLGHGHQDLDKVEDPDVLLKKEGETYIANAKLLQYNEITDENIDSFHFHGDTSTFPITAVIAVPPDRKSEDLLRGRYQSAGETCQILRPIDVIRDLTSTIFRVEGILNSVFGLLALSTILLIVLVVMLSLRLRRREMQTMFKLGCSRSMIAGLLAAELGIIVLVSAAATVALTALTARYVDVILRSLVL
jgi:putative ABC transport system permease protein